jgi:Patatin-like phospholipase
MPIGLALSGGGFRASLFHLGVIRRLRAEDRLRELDCIASVSGGSITAAHLLANCDKYNSSPKDFDTVASELISLTIEFNGDFPFCGYQHEIVVIGGRGRSVQARSCNAGQLALPADRHRAVLAVDEPTAVRGAHLPDLLAKKSRSTMSCPILACSRSISRSCSAAPSPLPFSNARAA